MNNQEKEQIVELDNAVSMLSRIVVSGDAVDLMAAAKALIRKVRSELEQSIAEEVNADG